MCLVLVWNIELAAKNVALRLSHQREDSWEEDHHNSVRRA
jgi:hypothetical protein